MIKQRLLLKNLSKNKKHKRTQDAQYWLGRVYFMKKSYEEAAIALAEYNSLYPDDKRFQETTLLIAESLLILHLKINYVKF